ncbi:hypothetical protein A4H97_20950 [Niastella yeongjuensis]|uniref:Uncharacterized protein n=1 Tax=Niastella yeongjuensis TaxID=354355 RepID=A0A1V9FCP3_9BACT|nr:BACON domain-containing protein [Niastella yeongjuensis]OQP56052.1 hypothetical protein A4H97_20950 [Niastella yeongjuensis]SEP24330.1 Putative binding domain-containing protein, N-terminal [Niastella yeongjuensis]
MRTKFYPYLVIFLLFILGYSCKKDDANSADPALNISRTDLQVGNDAGYTDTVVIQSNIDWTLSVSDEASAWLSVDPVKKTAGDSTIVTIKVIAANNSSSQTATITITPAGSDLQPRQINITRKAYNLVWQKCYGGSEDDLCFGTALLPNGQLVTAGMAYSTDGDLAGLTYYPTGWVMGAGSDGNRLWQKKVEPIGVQYRSITTSPDGGTVSLGYAAASQTYWYTDFFVVKFDANGNLVWNKQYGGLLAETPVKIISTADGGYVLAGTTYSNDGDFSTNHGGVDICIIKIDANGGVVWQKTFGGDKDENIGTIGACSDGSFIVYGMTASNNSGDVGTNHGINDLLVIKIDASGNKIWSKTLGGSRAEIPAAVIGDTDGGCIVTASTMSTDGDLAMRSGSDIDTWVVKFTKDGQIGWQSILGGTGVEVPTDMERLPNGNIALAGSIVSTDGVVTGSHGGGDVWVAVLNSWGKIVWQKAFGSTLSDNTQDVTTGADGSIMVTSLVNGNDGDVSGNHGKRDTWIFKLQ